MIAISLGDPHLQNNQSKMDWRCDSSGRVLLCKLEALSSNPLEKQKKREKNKELYSYNVPKM
jgi:hypothetical protein